MLELPPTLCRKRLLNCLGDWRPVLLGLKNGGEVKGQSSTALRSSVSLTFDITAALLSISKATPAVR
jgi:hypothetical protein